MKLYKIEQIYFLFNNKTEELLIEEPLYNNVQVCDYSYIKKYKLTDSCNFRFYKIGHTNATRPDFLKAIGKYL